MTELTAGASAPLHQIIDDLIVYQETLEMLEASIALSRQAVQPMGEIEFQRLPEIDEMRIGIEECTAKRDALAAQLARKTDDLAHVLRRLAAEQQLLKDDAARLRARAATAESAETWLREYVLRTMKANGIGKLKTAKNTLYTRSTETTLVEDQDLIPEPYWNCSIRMPLWLWNAISRTALEVASTDLEQDIRALKPVTEPSLSTIKKAIKSGVEVPGATLKFGECLVLR